MQDSKRSKYILYNILLIIVLTFTILLFLYIVNDSYRFGELTGIPEVAHAPLQFICLGIAALSFLFFILNIRKYRNSTAIDYNSEVLDDFDINPKDKSNSVILFYAKRLFLVSIGIVGLGFFITSTTSPSGFERIMGLPSGFAEPIVIGGLIIGGILLVISIILFLSHYFGNK